MSNKFMPSRQPLAYVRGSGLVTPAGGSVAETWHALRAGRTALVEERGGWVGRVPPHVEDRLQALQRLRTWARTDRTILLSLLAGDEALASAGIERRDDLAVILGSSRGATIAWEEEHRALLEKGKVSTLASPRTTAGSLAADVARASEAGGLSISVSSACSTSLHAVGIAASLIASGQSAFALAGGAEASLTDFTLAQLRALGLYGKGNSSGFPCRPMHPDRQGMILAEGAAVVALGIEPARSGDVAVLAYGAATEAATRTGVSEGGDGLVVAIERALRQARLQARDIDLVVGHGAGTVKGDQGEWEAYRRVFGDRQPHFTWHKWLTGHMLGASAASSLILACEHLRTGWVGELPYWRNAKSPEGGLGATAIIPQGGCGLISPPQTALVTALGFGGNAAAIILHREVGNGGPVHQRQGQEE